MGGRRPRPCLHHLPRPDLGPRRPTGHPAQAHRRASRLPALDLRQPALGREPLGATERVAGDRNPPREKRQVLPRRPLLRRPPRFAQGLTSLSASGVGICPTPKDEVWRRDKVVLYRYRPITERRIKQPMLIAFSVVGRHTIVDLQEDRSIVQAFLERGIDVYVLDWGTATRADRWLTIDDYVNDYIAGAVAAIRARENGEKVSLLGICEGGTFSLCYAALHPETLQSLILVVTPIDFHGEDPDTPPGHGFINVWSRNIPPAELDRLIEVHGNMPGELMGHVFAHLTPMRTLLKYNLDLMGLAADRDKLLNFLRMEKWIADRPPHPGEVIKQ